MSGHTCPNGRPLRVLMVSHTCQSRTEGQPKADRLAAMPGIDLKVLVPGRWRHYGRWRRADVPQGSPTYVVQRPLLAWAGPAQCYLHFYPRLGRLLREFRPDVIDLWEEPWGLVSAHACALRDRLLPSAKIVSETEQNLARRLPPPFEGFRSYTLRRADHLVGRSAAAVEVARAKGYRGPATVVPNAVDTDLFRPMDRGECRRRLGWPADKFVAGYVGRLVERKGIDDLLDALALCPAEVCGVFVGDGELAGRVRERAAASPDGRLRHVPAVPASELAVVMNALDVLVLPSRTTATWKEQFGRVIIEAHACGVPVIGTDSGAIPEVVGEGGVIYAEGDAAGLARRLVGLAGDARLVASLGAAGRRGALGLYSWAKVAEAMAGVYRALGARPCGPTACRTGSRCCR